MQNLPEAFRYGFSDLVGMQKVANPTDVFAGVVGKDTRRHESEDPSSDKLLAPRFEGADLGVGGKDP